MKLLLVQQCDVKAKYNEIVRNKTYLTVCFVLGFFGNFSFIHQQYTKLNIENLSQRNFDPFWFHLIKYLMSNCHYSSNCAQDPQPQTIYMYKLSDLYLYFIVKESEWSINTHEIYLKLLDMNHLVINYFFLIQIFKTLWIFPYICIKRSSSYRSLDSLKMATTI